MAAAVPTDPPLSLSRQRTAVRRLALFVFFVVAAVSLVSNALFLSRHVLTVISPSPDAQDMPNAFRASLPLHPAATDAAAFPSRRNPVAETASKTTVHVLYGLAGKHEGFLSEFRISLKSVLLNAPVHAPMVVHVMATQGAYQTIQPHLRQLTQWRTAPSISVHLYNVQRHLPRWRQTVLKRVFAEVSGKAGETAVMGHTMGSYFRLFCHEVLLGGCSERSESAERIASSVVDSDVYPGTRSSNNDRGASVRHVLYMDTDVVLMASAEGVWKQVEDQVERTPLSRSMTGDTSKSKLFYWGIGVQCSGFVVVDVPQLPVFWNVTYGILSQSRREANKSVEDWVTELDNSPNDQLLFRMVQKVRPDLVGRLSPEWDTTLAKLWKHSPMQDTVRRNGVGMLHFNGGGHSKDSAFVSQSKFLTSQVDQASWGLANYYVHMPWNWARFIVESRSASLSATAVPASNITLRLYECG